ncbi:hypothetical protein PH213_20515 [Streptomyces sp. SRF1]|uniref:hypothetical protein n=1 Tax=Streptomyces sp. SRF1 TaxID=1549642 RepID=UPI0025AF201C|nr:hypothetical protein [Streptomyces sp. SRF1]MDN3056891.1 hypothetical protein [Streptomyces sp. SRF1]
MRLLDALLARDRELASTKYTGRERHRTGGAMQAARKGQAWEDAGRLRDIRR